MKEHFSTLADFIDRAAAKPATAINCSVTGSAAFTGTRSFSEAVRLANEGWPEGRAAVEAARAHLEHVTGSRTRRAVTIEAFAGFAPDVPAFLAGSPECMLAREDVEAEAAGKIVRIVVQGVASGGVSPREIVERGALIVALVDALESAGRSVELTVDFTFGDRAPRRVSAVLVAKQAGEPVEIDRLAFILAHPSMLRRFAFGFCEKHAFFMNQVEASYGTCGHADDRGDLYVPASDLRHITDGDAVSWFRRQLAAVGITFDA